MNAATIAALATAIPAILAALAGFITAIRAKNTATIAQGTAIHANNTINAHLTREHDEFPIQPPVETNAVEHMMPEEPAK